MKLKKYELKITILLLLLFFGHISLNAQKVTIDPNQRYQIFEGWGASLSWWANVVGGWPDEEIIALCEELTSPDELHMNIWKYNIHGGDNPDPHSPETERILPDGSTTHFRWESLPMTSYKPTPASPYDWTANTNQRKVLQLLLAQNPEAILEAISYSPPYWMTNSGCSSGGINSEPNLPDTSIEPYAELLTDIVKHYHDNFGITFQSLSAFNEANNNTWKLGGKQEGCKASIATLKTMYSTLHDKLQEKNMLNYCVVSALDESSINVAKNTFYNFSFSDTIMPKIGLITTHSYAGFARSGFSEIAQRNNRKLWQSEFGGNVNSGTKTYIWHAERVIEDLEDMHVNAWLDWQIVSGGPWGLYSYDFAPGNQGIQSRTLYKTKLYYSRKQFSKYIKPGYQIIRSEDENTLAALNLDKTELVVVTVNRNLQELQKNMDLSRFVTTGTNAQVIRTSLTENATLLPDVPVTDGIITYTAPAESVTTFVIPVTVDEPCEPLADGLYHIKVKHSDKYMSVNGVSSANLALITQWEFIDQDNLKFVVKRIGFDYVITPAYNDRVLTIAAKSEENDAVLNQFQDNGFDNQRFNIIPDDEPGYYKIINKNSNLYLSVQGSGLDNGVKIVQFEDLDLDSFKWQFEPVVETPVLENEMYRIRAVHSNQYMAVAGGGSSNGALIEQSDFSEEDRLIFEVIRDLDGYYYLQPSYNSKLISVSQAPSSAGASVHLFSNIAAINQKFRITALEDEDQYRITPKFNSAKALGVVDAGQDIGDNIQALDYTDESHLKWIFEPISEVLHVDQLMRDDTPIIYPNPTFGKLVIKWKDNITPSAVKLYTMAGKEVQRFKVTKNAAEIMLDKSLDQGIYILRFTKENNTFWKKIILKK